MRLNQLTFVKNAYMVNLLNNILSILLISFLLLDIQKPMSNDESVCLPEIELSNYPHLNRLITRIVKEAKGVTNNRVDYLSVDLTNDTCGIRMEIVAHVRKRLFWYDKYGGYAIVDGKPVIFENRSNLQLKEVPNSKSIFPMAGRFDPPFVYDPDVWLFILKKNCYARYFEGRGWVWFQYENCGAP